MEQSKKGKSLLYHTYKKFQDLPIVSTLSFLVYIKIRPFLARRLKGLLFQSSSRPQKRIAEKAEKINGLKIAFICDEMTYRDFKEECQAIYLTPDNWKKVMKEEKPDFLFCESAWSGIFEYPDCWRCRIYRNHYVLFEHRKELLRILSYCRNQDIPTVFWNKEDPVFFGNKRYDFVDTALKFDYVFTTAKECIPYYQERGHRKVFVLMFGFSPSIFYYLPGVRKKNTAVFAGSWYADQPERCRDMEEIFDEIISKGISLEIYDRHYGSANPIHQFPEKYSRFLRPKVKYEELVKIYNQADYGIDINTVKNSETMFARRVFELMACGMIVISNESLGLKRLFNNRIWFIGEAFDQNRKEAIRRENMAEVNQKHTCKKRLEEIVEKVETIKLKNCDGKE